MRSKLRASMNDVPSGEPLQPDQRGIAALISWANNQDGWVRLALGEILSTRQQLPDARLDAIYEAFLIEKGLAEGSAAGFAELVAPAAGRETEKPLRLVRLQDVRHVNRLASGQTVTFHPQLTVLYGENGAGKTGYVRILKRAASVRSATQILPDVAVKNTGAVPHATIVYALNGTEAVVEWNNETGLAPLTRLDVFDSMAAPVHLDGELTYVYTPRELALFPLVSHAVNGVKDRLERTRREREPKSNPFLSRFSRSVTFYNRIESLSAATDIKELEALAQISTDEESGLAALRERVEALKPHGAEAKLQVAQADVELFRLGKRALDIVGRFDGDTYNAAIEELRAAEAAHASATKSAFVDAGIPAVLSDSWRGFIEAGERYIQEHTPSNYPRADGAHCVYCRQALDDAARTLVVKYRDYSNNEHQKRVERAREALRKTSDELRSLDVATIKAAVAKKVPSDAGLPQSITKLLGVIDAVAQVQASIAKSEKMSEATRARSLGQAALAEIDASLKDAETLASDLRGQANERQRLFTEASSQLTQLEARLVLRSVLPQIREHVDAAKWTAKATQVGARLPSLGKSLTEVAKSASKVLLNQDFEQRFRSECGALKAPHVELDFPGRSGEAVRRKRAGEAHKPSEVLSEGEQKVVALADFLAEASLKASSSPIVFDDPVTSLDHKRIAYVVSRVLELSVVRQVIVFTHNIIFLKDLWARVDDEKIPCAFALIEESEAARGVVSDGLPRLDVFSKVVKRIETSIASARKATGEDRAAFIEKGYEHVRNACELFVEQQLFCGVTERLQPHLRMTKLSELKPAALGPAIAVAGQLWAKACRYIASHSQPTETLSTRPQLPELEADLKALQDAHDAHKKAS